MRWINMIHEIRIDGKSYQIKSADGSHQVISGDPDPDDKELINDLLELMEKNEYLERGDIEWEMKDPKLHLQILIRELLPGIYSYGLHTQFGIGDHRGGGFHPQENIVWRARKDAIREARLKLARELQEVSQDRGSCITEDQEKLAREARIQVLQLTLF